MTAEVVKNSFSNNIIQQLAITGLSCRIATVEPKLLNVQNFWQNRVDNNQIESIRLTVQNPLLLELAKEALFDANIDRDFYPNIRINLLAYNASFDLSSANVSNLTASLEMGGAIGIAESFGQALEMTQNQLKSNEVTAVMFILIDYESTAALVFRRKEEAYAQKQRIYALPVFVHEQEINTDGNQYQALNDIYNQKDIPENSIGLVTLVAPSYSAIQSHLSSLSQCFHNSKKVRCPLRASITSDLSESTNLIVPLIETIVSLQQRATLPAPISEISLDLADTTFYQNASVRPWLFPQIHKYLAQLNPQLSELIIPNNLRRAAFHHINKDGFVHLLLEESSDAREISTQDLKTNWESELFTFFAPNKQQLFNHIEAAKRYLDKYNNSNLKDFAFTVNSWFKQQLDKAITENSGQLDLVSGEKSIKIAFVSSSCDDVRNKLNQILQRCLNDEDTFDIYWHDQSPLGNEIAKGKLAFVLPGLGTAYPDMLIELCLHFPEIRAIFDFVDHIAVSAGSPIKPSDRIFPRRDRSTKTSTESPASLAMMDSAVITVLIAEWSIFTLLFNLAIMPDVLLGCSTGEFGAITMSGSIDILAAAHLFYHLSTGISKALPFNRLINLRSLKINTAFTRIKKYLDQYKDKIHLSADLSDKQLLVTGDKDSINILAKTLEDNNISADFLPFAIPYHTPLVADIVSPQDPDVLALQIEIPLIESWSCSLVDKYPPNPAAIRTISTELFSKPILFRDSIEALHTNGVRKYVEVGPRGSLAPIISETLESKPHISLAANRADVSAITQLNHTLAALFVNDVYMNTHYLFRRRSPILLPVFDQIIDHFVEKQTNSLSNLADKNNIMPEQQIAPVPISLTDQFREQLLNLEQQTLSALESHNKSLVLPEIWMHYVNHPTSSFFSRDLDLAHIFSQLGSVANIICREANENELPLNDAVLSRCADYILTPVELLTFRSFRQLSKRRQWLAGRLAIKEAVRSLMNKVVLLSNTEIEISSEDSGKIYLSKINSDYAFPVISLSHKEGKIVAVAADSNIFSAVGIDLESIDSTDDSLAELAFSDKEKMLMQSSPKENKNLNFKKIWSAKEAAAKVLGLALPEHLKRSSVVEYDQKMTQLAIEFTLKNNHLQSNSLNGYLPGPIVEESTITLPTYVTDFQNMIMALSFLSVSATTRQ